MNRKNLLSTIYKYLDEGGEIVSVTQDVDSIISYIRSQKNSLSRLPIPALQSKVRSILEEITPKKKPKLSQPATLKFADIGGIDHIMPDIEKTIIYPIRHPEIYAELRIEPARGVLLCGPPGTGKTYLANAICGELNVPFFKVAGTEIVSGMSGESEQKVRELFHQAFEAAPSILFIDEIDAITPNRNTVSKDMERRIVSQLLVCLDELGGFLTHNKLVIVIAATSRIESIDPALRMAGRFDREIHFGIPSEIQRLSILKTLLKRVKLRGDFNLEPIANKTPGYVGADLHSLVKEAGNIAVYRAINSNNLNLNELFVEQDDLEQAISKVQPSSRREGFTTIPETEWTDVGGLHKLREELFYSIVNPIQNPSPYNKLAVPISGGVLLSGPPGCGKTLLAKAVANESRANFIAVNGPEILNKYVGESEKAIRQIFQRARDSAPCIVFFDEIDSLCAERGGDNHATERVVNQLLTELNGLQDRRQVFVIAATNRPDIIDPAMLRPGRLDKKLVVSLPTQEDRAMILNTHLRKTPCRGINIDEIARDTEAFSGADLACLVREAAICALKEGTDLVVEHRHFLHAITKVRPSVK